VCESALFGNKGFSFVFCKWEVTVVVECNSTIVLDCFLSNWHVKLFKWAPVVCGCVCEFGFNLCSRVSILHFTKNKIAHLR